MKQYIGMAKQHVGAEVSYSLSQRLGVIDDWRIENDENQEPDLLRLASICLMADIKKHGQISKSMTFNDLKNTLSFLFIARISRIEQVFDELIKLQWAQIEAEKLINYED